MSRKYLIWSVVSIVVGLIIITLLMWEKDKRLLQKAKAPVVVKITVAQSMQWNDEIVATGVINAEQAVMIRAEVSGRVTKTYDNSGKMVKAQDIILQINPEGLQKQLEHDQANLKLMQEQFDQTQAIYKKGVASKAQFDQALANLKQAQADAAQTEQKLALCQVKAPFDGVLGIRLVNIGDFVNIGQSLISIQNPNTLRVDFSIPAAVIDEIAVGQTVKIHSNIFPNQEITGNVIAYDAIANQNDNTVLVRARIIDPPNKLVSGSFVTVTVLIDKPHNAIVIPQTSIVYAVSGPTVYKVINGIATQSPVHLGTRRGDNVVVLSGLNVGDEIVSVGKDKVTNGDQVVNVK